MAYKIYLNGEESVLNIAKGNRCDPWVLHGLPSYAFSNGRTAQKVLREHKLTCVEAGLSLDNLTFTIEKGEFVPFEETE